MIMKFKIKTQLTITENVFKAFKKKETSHIQYISRQFLKKFILLVDKIKIS